MIKPEAQIHIKNLRLRTYIGFNESEKENKQDVIINAWIHYPATQAYDTDNVEKAVNYRTICKEMIAHTENNRFLLLEKLTADLLALCMSADHVTFAKVEVAKPHALRFADSVSLTLSATREPQA
ncbi:MAG: dihydroneopterin triphosphate 2'-epimerase [Marinomonas sp.]|jgi:D-erythro-7,8-dihydroneopterin triphosphate epimerase|uniref:Dihydroneopterin triphosphate 2'-epimerase n=1 Tax=Marinomonas pontica TaxID=264739 RepID=A0ABM8FBJ4_9GAMM|nr:dihydroneopterin triphosphate 2'-epimerase [Marinomonas pontica]MCW8356484.1 dihydroneopterin triphosphate 2'-epimerase [Marinomonas pontica]BDX02450.1 dihydroneopterin triphosphate 2'-epimerase [Marinomonas pontica]